MNEQWLHALAERVEALLLEQRALLTDGQTAFYVWPRQDRAVIVFDTAVIDLRRVNERLAHYLSTRLQGRRVVQTNHRGLYWQVGYEIPPALMEMNEKPLDLSTQPTPVHIPIGTTQRGDLWISLLDANSILVGGSRRMGKTGLMHGFIQSLLHGNCVELYAWDGKGGIEFMRYVSQPRFNILPDNLQAGLGKLKLIVQERRKRLLESGQTNILEYNEAHPNEPMLPICLMIDEAALVPDAMRPALVELVEREGAAGIYPILATNRPEQSSLLVKANLVTRISLSVPSWNASMMVLGRTGAETLHKTRGRGLMEWQAREIRFQSFAVDYPQPDPDAVRAALVAAQAETVESEPVVSEEDAQIMELINAGNGNAAIVRKVWGVTGGSTLYRLRDRVQALRVKIGTSSTSSSTKTGDISLESVAGMVEEEVLEGANP